MVLRDHLSRAARILLTATAGATGRAFFEAMARSLAEALEVKFGLVGELVGSEVVETRGYWDGERFSSMRYGLRGTPCEQVILTHSCHYPAGVALRFPDDTLLEELGIESYIGVPIHAYDGAPLGILVGLHTAPTRFGADLEPLLCLFAMRAAAELERERAEARRRALELRAMQGQKLESLGLLAGGIAHDFNNLLVGISGNLDLALLEDGVPAPARRTIADALTAAQRASELTRQLLLYAGKGPTRRSPVDLGALVQEMGRLLGSAIDRRAALRLELTAGLPAIDGDATQLRQLVMNLLTNASDALAGEPGDIVVRTELAEVDAEAARGMTLAEHHRPGPYLVLTVRDSGVGMDPETLARIFDPFFSTKTQGRGLGLATALGTLRSHQALLHLESAIGAGTTFRIYFPVPGPAPVPTPEPEEPPAGDPALTPAG